MSSYVECEKIDIKCEDSLSLTQLQVYKNEPQECEEFAVTEHDDIDIKHDIQAESHFVATMKIESEDGIKDILENNSELHVKGRENIEGVENNVSEVQSVNKIYTSDYDPGIEKPYTCYESNSSALETNQTHLHTEVAEFSRTGNSKKSSSQQSDGGTVKFFPCDKCNKSFSHKSTLNKHIKYKHIGQEPFTCNKCSKSFSVKSNLNRHMNIHRGKIPFSCNICSKSFCLKSKLNSHMQDHSQGPPFKCDMCNKSFSRKGNLNAHVIYKHSSQQAFTCNVCSKSFCWKSDLNRHMYIHTGNKPYTCDMCNHKFSHKWYLNKHIMHKHMGVQPFTCKICNKSFSRKYDRKRHMNVHVGDKPFVCDLCNQSFSHKGNVVAHIMRKHTGPQFFICKICDEHFFSKSELDCHMHFHDGTTIDQCDV